MDLTLTTGNWFFRWAYLFTTQRTRDAMQTTTLCDLFWRSVLLTPLQILTLALAVVILLDSVIETGVQDFLRGMALAASIAAAIVAAICVWIFVEESVTGERHTFVTTVVDVTREGVKGIKERYCPLVRIDRQ